MAPDYAGNAQGTFVNMVPRFRRCLPFLIFFLLATPLVAGLIIPENEQEVLKEGRKRAPAPSVPHSWDELTTLPKEVDDYLDDRFGLRKQMIRCYANLTKRLLAGGDQKVLVGLHDQMFFLGEDSVRQSAGLVRRDSRVAETADFLVAMRDALRQRGIRLVVASPPNAATIYQDYLPRWARSNGRTTEYDLFIADLAARGIKAIDLRPTMWMVRSKGPAYFLYDTHWTPRAALAGFNAIAEADGRREWRIDPSVALAPLTQRQGGDLARMIGVSDDVAEPTQDLALPPVSKVELTAQPYASYVATRGKPGETIMVMGDSFTITYFAPMLLNHVGQVVWQHHNLCGFDWKLIDRFRPDEVWWMPTERYLLCGPNVRPDGFPPSSGL
jgi:alginate O-acetyltransferase complex protein AlgJ